MIETPKVRDRVHVAGRRGVFIIVSVQGDTAHVMALDGSPRVFSVAFADIELETEMKPRAHPGENGGGE